MNKLIKLSDSHYIIVDDSKIQKGDCFIMESLINDSCFTILTANSDKEGEIKGRLKVVLSTETVEFYEGKNGEVVEYYNKIKPLSLSEVEEAINGYSVDYKLEDFEYERKQVYLKTGSLTACEILDRGVSLGFKAHQELVKDKLFTIEDMKKAIDMAFEKGRNRKSFYTSDYYQIIKSLLPKTEWDIEFIDGKIKLI